MPKENQEKVQEGTATNRGTAHRVELSDVPKPTVTGL